MILTRGYSLLDVGADAGDQAAATHRHEDRIDLTAGLLHDLHADGALAGDHVRIVERMHEGHVALARQRERLLIGGIEDVPVQHHLGSQIACRLHLDGRGGLGHHDQRRHAAPTRCQRYALRVVARRGADHAASRDGRRQVRDLVVGAAQLE